MNYKNYEEIKVWQDSLELSKKIYRNVNRQSFQRDFGLIDQVRRAAVSIPSNIAEGFERNSKKEFIQYLAIAKGSVGELRTQLYIVKDIGYLSKENTDSLIADCVSVSNQLGGFIKYLRKAVN